MIKTLEERLADRRKIYDALKIAEHQTQRIIDSLPDTFFTEKDYVNIYEAGAYFYLYPANVDEAELDIIPALSDRFPKDKWSKSVDKAEITYRLYAIHSDPDFTASFCVTPRVHGTCRIIPVATGKTVRRHKYIDVEEPEINYVVDCSDEPEQEPEIKDEV